MRTALASPGDQPRRLPGAWSPQALAAGFFVVSGSPLQVEFTGQNRYADHHQLDPYLHDSPVP